MDERDIRSGFQLTAGSLRGVIGGSRLKVTGGTGILADVGADGRAVTIRSDPKHSRPVFWIGEVVSSASSGSNRWTYRVRELQKSATGYDAWAVKTNGRDITTCLNLAEDQNAATGVQGNGVDVADLTGTYALQPIPNDTRVIVQRVGLRDGSDVEHVIVGMPNGVTGDCPDPPLASSIAFDPTSSDLDATDVQAAVDEFISAKSFRMDAFDERTAGAGVTIDGVHLKDGEVDGVNIVTLESTVSDIDTSGANVKRTFNATTDPGATDDTASGYGVGSRWVNVTADTHWVCVDATTAAAVWTETTAAGGGGSGDVVGPASAADNAVARFDTTTGKLLQDGGGVTIDDAGNITVPGTVDGRDVATDGTKLDGISSGADVTPTTLSALNTTITDATLIDTADSRLSDDRAPTNHASDHTDGTDDIQDATAAQKGLATAAQITKLDGIETGAEVNVSPSIYYALGASEQTITTSWAVIDFDAATVSDTGYSEASGVVTIASDLDGERAEITAAMTVNAFIDAGLSLDIDTGSGFVSKRVWYGRTGASISGHVVTLATSMKIRCRMIRYSGSDTSTNNTGTSLLIRTMP